MASVEKLPSGKYRARVTYKVGGSWRQKSFTAETKKAALREAALFAPAKYDGTVGQMLDQYISAKEAVLSPSTVAGYRSLARTLKTRHAAFCGLTEVSEKAAQQVANSFSPKTSRNIIALVSSAVRFAGGSFPRVSFARWELRSDFIPREDDVQRIVQEVSGTDMEIPVALGIMGLRRSEILGLSLDDLDGDLLHIHQAVVLGADNRPHQKDPKTPGSDRVIAIPSALADRIREQGHVTDLTGHAITNRFKRLAARLGISIRFHDLRHYFVSYCHNILRLSDAQIQALGGWSTNSVLRRHYLHSMQNEETARLVASAFSATISATKTKKP